MKATTLELPLKRWPYSLEQPSEGGLILRPQRKARTGWARAFRRLRQPRDELALVRQFANKFDSKEWVW